MNEFIFPPPSVPRFTVFFIDVSGNRSVGDVVKLIDAYERVRGVPGGKGFRQ